MSPSSRRKRRRGAWPAPRRTWSAIISKPRILFLSVRPPGSVPMPIQRRSQFQPQNCAGSYGKSGLTHDIEANEKWLGSSRGAAREDEADDDAAVSFVATNFDWRYAESRGSGQVTNGMGRAGMGVNVLLCTNASRHSYLVAGQRSWITADAVQSVSLVRRNKGPRSQRRGSRTALGARISGVSSCARRHTTRNGASLSVDASVRTPGSWMPVSHKPVRRGKGSG